MQRRLDSRPQSIMGNELLIARAASVVCRTLRSKHLPGENKCTLWPEMKKLGQFSSRKFSLIHLCCDSFDDCCDIIPNLLYVFNRVPLIVAIVHCPCSVVDMKVLNTTLQVGTLYSVTISLFFC